MYNIRSKQEIYSLGLVKEYCRTKGKVAVESENIYSPYDLLATPSNLSKDGMYLEVKHRRLDKSLFLRYAPEGFMIQRDKYNFLKDVNGVYVNTISLNDMDIILLWLIGERGVIIKDYSLTTLTSSTDFSGSDCIKSVSYLPIEKAEIAIRYKNLEGDNISNEWVTTTSPELYKVLEYSK